MTIDFTAKLVEGRQRANSRPQWKRQLAGKKAKETRIANGTDTWSYIDYTVKFGRPTKLGPYKRKDCS